MSNTNSIDSKCCSCLKEIGNYQISVKCINCRRCFHGTLECMTTLDTDILKNRKIEICLVCLNESLPFQLLDDFDCQGKNSNENVSEKDMDRLNQLKFNPFSLNNDNIALNESNVKLDMVNNLNTINCNYYTPNNFKEKTNVINTGKSFSIFHLNIRSMANKFDTFKQLIISLNIEFQIMGLTETWLIDDDVNNFGLEGFKYICVNRSNKKCGGVGIYYVNEKVKYKLRNDININLENLIESIFIEIITSTGKNVIVGVTYRPPNQKIETFEKAVDEIVKVEVKSVCKQTVCLHFELL